MATSKTYPSLTANEAAALIPNGAMVAVSGFTPAGAPKAVPRALAKRARELHQAGTAFQVKLLSGASTGEACDDELAGAEAVSWRAPYITSAPMRQLANTGKIEFVRHVPFACRTSCYGGLPRYDRLCNHRGNRDHT